VSRIGRRTIICMRAIVWNVPGNYSGADVRPDFDWNTKPVGTLVYK
jgi:hypothetical protein